MDNYSKVLTFFMENGIQLNNEQLEALKEEFLEEKAESSHKRIEHIYNKNYDKEHGFYPGSSDEKKKYNGDDIAGVSKRYTKERRYEDRNGKDHRYSNSIRNRIKKRNDEYIEGIKNNEYNGTDW